MKLQGYKTYLIAAAMLVFQLLRWYFDGTAPDVMGVLEAAGLATLRAGVNKSAPRDEQAP